MSDVLQTQHTILFLATGKGSLTEREAVVHVCCCPLSGYNIRHTITNALHHLLCHKRKL